MTNSTFWKYTNLYTVNRYHNDLFEEWLKAHYEVKEGYSVWNYGQEIFIDRNTGEEVRSDAVIMWRYVKGKNPYFRDFVHIEEYLDSDLSIQAFFAK